MTWPATRATPTQARQGNLPDRSPVCGCMDSQVTDAPHVAGHGVSPAIAELSIGVAYNSAVGDLGRCSTIRTTARICMAKQWRWTTAATRSLPKTSCGC